MTNVSKSAWHVISRIGAGVLGSYVFTWGFIALGASALIAAGTEFHEASSLVSLFSFPLYLCAFCWAFIAGSLAIVWGVLAWGGALMALAGWWIAHLLV